MLLLVAASEGFWQIDSVLGSATELERAEFEDRTTIVRAEAQLRRTLRRSASQQAHGFAPPREANRRAPRRTVPRTFERGVPDESISSGRHLLHQQRRLLI